LQKAEELIEEPGSFSKPTRCIGKHHRNQIQVMVRIIRRLVATQKPPDLVVIGLVENRIPDSLKQLESARCHLFKGHNIIEICIDDNMKSR